MECSCICPLRYWDWFWIRRYSIIVFNCMFIAIGEFPIFDSTLIKQLLTTFKYVNRFIVHFKADNWTHRTTAYFFLSIIINWLTGNISNCKVKYHLFESYNRYQFPQNYKFTLLTNVKQQEILASGFLVHYLQLPNIKTVPSHLERLQIIR